MGKVREWINLKIVELMDKINPEVSRLSAEVVVNIYGGIDEYTKTFANSPSALKIANIARPRTGE